MNTQPQYRADIAGNVKASIEDFECGIRNEMAHSDDFIFAVTDSHNFEQWKDYLTLAEMTSAFKRARAMGC